LVVCSEPVFERFKYPCAPLSFFGKDDEPKGDMLGLGTRSLKTSEESEDELVGAGGLGVLR
jgi:hypothetical protein